MTGSGRTWCRGVESPRARVRLITPHHPIGCASWHHERQIRLQCPHERFHAVTTVDNEWCTALRVLCITNFVCMIQVIQQHHEYLKECHRPAASISASAASSAASHSAHRR